MRVWNFFLLLGLLIAGFSTACFAEDTFLTVADIHFDPFLGCKTAPKPCPLLSSLQKASPAEWNIIFEKSSSQAIGAAYEDTGYPLLKSALTQLQLVYTDKHPHFVLVLGDFLAHKFRKQFILYSGDRSAANYRAFVKKTMAYLADELRQVFPDVDIYPVIGNNDSYTGDYSVIPHGEFLKDLRTMWAPLILNANNRASFERTFSQAGFYAVTIPNQPQHKIIILNTVIFSEKSKTKAADLAAKVQMQWLHQQLEIAKIKKQKVLLAFHIPVGLNIFGLKSRLASQPFWKLSDTDEFESDLRNFYGEIIALLPAHIHIEISHSIILKELSNVPVDFTPSISPIFGNDPGFKLFTYDIKTLTIQKIQTYYFPLQRTMPEWHKEYSEKHSLVKKG